MIAAGATRGRSSVGIGRTRIPLRTAFVVMLGLLYLPIGILFLFSFNAGTQLAFPLEGFTTDWYAAALEDDALLEAARNSFVVGIASAIAGLVIIWAIRQFGS